MKVVFDTNVLISGFLTVTGSSQYILRRALRSHQVILSDYVLKEFEEKLTRKLGMPGHLVKEAILFLRRRAVILDVLERAQVKFGDQKDIPILNLIHTSKAHYFVTGDKKLLDLKRLGPTVFLSPREAMEML